MLLAWLALSSVSQLHDTCELRPQRRSDRFVWCKLSFRKRHTDNPEPDDNVSDEEGSDEADDKFKEAPEWKITRETSPFD